jgi:hypothetical protein
VNGARAKELVSQLANELIGLDSEAIKLVLVMLEDAETDSRRLDFLEEHLDEGVATLTTKVAGDYEKDEDNEGEGLRGFIDFELAFVMEDYDRKVPEEGGGT